MVTVTWSRPANRVEASHGMGGIGGVWELVQNSPRSQHTRGMKAVAPDSPDGRLERAVGQAAEGAG